MRIEIKHGFVAAVALLAAMSSACGAQNDRMIPVAGEKRSDAPGRLELPFDLPDVPQGKQVWLSLDMRNEGGGQTGFMWWASFAVNGAAILGPDLLNKRLDFFCRNGADVSWASGKSWIVLYSSEFSNAPTTRPDPWGFFPEDEPFHFVWDITRSVKPGRNVIVVDNPKILSTPTALVVKDVRVEVGDPIRPRSSPTAAPAAAGALATYVAHADNPPVGMTVQLSASGTIRVQVGGRAFDIISRTSEPEGKWITSTGEGAGALIKGQPKTAQWSGAGYTVRRQVTLFDDRIQVADTFSNTSDKIVGIICQNRLLLPREEKLKIRLGGWPQYAPTQESDNPAHPSAIAEMDGLAIGLFAEDDIFRVHVCSFLEPGIMGIGDPHLGIGPGKSHTLEWSFYPVLKGDYWDLINAVRRNWGSNYEIPGPFVFDGQAQTPRSQEAVAQWVKSRGVQWVSTMNTEYLGQDELAKYGGPYRIDQAMGTALPLAATWRKNMVDWIRKVHATCPGVKTMTYLNTEICTEPNAQTLYADSRSIGADGKQAVAVYPHPIYLYLPTLENSYGKALQKTVKDLVAETGLDGIYNDEFNGGAEAGSYCYDTTWDGCSLDMDPVTHAIVRQCSSNTLMQLPWKVWMIKYLRDQGKVILGNDSIHTRTMLRLKVPAFMETTGCYAHLINAHLACPLGLGNHDSDFCTPQSRARQFRHMLDQGSLLAIYQWPAEPKGRPFIDYMHPITPMEIRAGMILGEERIITNRSGRYGWQDGSRADVFEFDANGELVPSPKIVETRDGGAVRIELRMPGDHFAVLIKKALPK